MRIVSYSAGLTQRNFNLGQTMYNYDFFNRSDKTDGNGNPQLSTPDAAEVLQASLQHVVATFDPATGRKIYVNGVLVASNDPAPGGSLNDWDDTFAFVLGNEVSGNADWAGVIRLVAIHNRALTLSSDPAELPGRRRREVLPDVQRGAPDEHPGELRRVRGLAVRQLQLPVPQAVLHQPGRHAAPGHDRCSRLAHRYQRRRSARGPGVREPEHADHDGAVQLRHGPVPDRISARSCRSRRVRTPTSSS